MPSSTRIVIVVGLLNIVCLPALAQTPPNASRALEVISTPPDLAGKPEVSLPQPESARDKVERAQESEYRFQVDDFRLVGAKRFPEAELKALLSELKGRKISLVELNKGTDLINKYYRDHALPFVQVFIPPQDVTEGIVEIRIVEGRVGKVDTKIESNSRVKPAISSWLTKPFPVGSAIDYGVLTRNILLLNDLPGVQAKVDLGPGASIGDVGLLLNVSDRGPLTNFSLDVDNHGVRSIGADRVGGTMRLNNLSGMGDQLVGRLQHSSGNGVNTGQISYQRPLGYNGLKLGAQVSKTSYETGASVPGLEGNGVTWNVNTSYPLVRSRGANLNLNGAFEYRDITDKLFGTSFDKSLNILMFGVDGDVTDTWRGGGVTSYAINFNLGEVGNNSPGAVHGGYNKLSWDIQRRQFLNEKQSLLGKIRGQMPSKNLDGSEQLSLGGPNGVRGYPVGYSPSDTAMIASAEWQYAMGEVGQGFSLVPSAFIDYSFSRDSKSPKAGNSQNLWSLGVGVMAYRPGKAQISLMLARRGAFDDPLNTEDNDRYRFWVQAVFSF